MSAVLDPSVLDALRGYDSPTLSNAIELFDVRPRDEGYMRHDVRCMFPDLPRIVGYAATATMRARGTGGGYDPDALTTHVQAVPGPRIVVVQDLDDEPAHGALWGEVMATMFTRLECLGAVTDGSVRDLDEAREMGFHFFARAVSVSHGYARVEGAGEPVTVGGLRVDPGDLLHADKHGVLQIPAEIAAELPAAADRVMAAEQEFIGWVSSPEFDPAQLPQRRNKMKDAFTR
ncbi:RraA family protein [Pseudonocardia kunmingensis]|uniref:Putative 4-hydroxy-4-methyl-2-oxoglutarate aldolase n=1 Tax=Pseudonocardia kunmingensis TaxID=630975 RepID=A0A543DQP5_9PSEU|nr:RraA family protein [Pseudonocardia kunmingensis]TQM11647.1 regulator of RNase E activity RraA [Pseudonocardia kunmingensis]